MENKTITHFSHPNHLLSMVRHGSDDEYVCGGCKTSGRGPRYRCTTCTNFNLHHLCAICPATTTFFMCPNKNLTLLVPTPGWSIICNVCAEPIHGMFYNCCNFDAHPICAHLPETVNGAPAHPDHPLSVVWSHAPTTCHACREDCVEWRYRCKTGCNIDFHLECLHGVGDDEDEEPATNVEHATTTTRGLFGRPSSGGQRRRKRDVIYSLFSFAETASSWYSIGQAVYDFFLS